MSKRVICVVALIVALLAIAPSGPVNGRRASATEHELRNVLIIVTDDQRLDGTMWALPSIRKWFGEQGTEFANTYATTPLCCPSRASILTGRYAHNHRVQHNGREARDQLDFDRTLPAFFKAQGYRTGLFGKFFNKWPRDIRPPHFDRWAMSGAGYYNARFNFQGEMRRVRKYATHVVSNRASRFMNASIDSGRPWFMYVATVAAHSPFTPEKAYAKTRLPARYMSEAVAEEDRSDKPPWVANRFIPDPARVREMYEGQLRSLLSVDDMVDRLFTELDARGQADNTIAVFTSDNGFLWGEHGLTRKKYPYLPSIEVPMYVRSPGQFPAGAIDDRIAANIDIAPTVLEGAGIETDETFDGMSLLQPTERRSLFLEYVTTDGRETVLPNWDAVINDSYQYIVYSSLEGEERFREYYDLNQDPEQLNNLLGDQDPNNDPPMPMREALDAQIEMGRTCEGSSCWLLP